jgi:tetratricopeptide (TPR) repeat protein
VAAWNILVAMTTGPGLTARELCAAADEALTEASFRSGEFADAEKWFEQGLALSVRDGDLEGQARALTGLGLTHHSRNIAGLVRGQRPADGEVAAEEDLMRRALDVCRQTADSAGTARALFGMGLVHQVLRRDWAAAMPYYWQAYGLAEALEESGDLYGRSEIHRHLGFYYGYCDVRPREAVRQFTYSLALRERLGDPRRIPSALVALSEAELAAGNPGHAADLAGRAVTMAAEAALLPWRIDDAREALRAAQAALAATVTT